MLRWLALLALLACERSDPVPTLPAPPAAPGAAPVEGDAPREVVVHLPHQPNLTRCNTCYRYAEPECISFPLRATWSRSATVALFLSDAPLCRLMLAAVSPAEAPLAEDVLATSPGGWTEAAIRQAVLACVEGHRGRVLATAALEHVPAAARVLDDGSSILVYSGMFFSDDVPLVEFRDADGRLVGSVPGELELEIPLDGADLGWSRSATLLWVDAAGCVVIAEKATPMEDTSRVSGWRRVPGSGCLPLDVTEILASARSILLDGRPEERAFAADVLHSAGVTPR